ncbi:unnamed protein product [Gadus morhua 'NCC']
MVQLVANSLEVFLRLQRRVTLPPTVTERLGRLDEQSGPPSLPSGQEGLPLRRPDSQDEREDEADDVLSLLEDTTGGVGRGGEPRTDSRGESTGVGETHVSSLMSRVLSAANILGLQPPTPDPVPQGVVWEGVSHTSPPPSIPMAEDYSRMLTSSWGRASKRPRFIAGCRQLAMTVYPAEAGLGDMPPVEESIASWTSLGPARVSSNPSRPLGYECQAPRGKPRQQRPSLFRRHTEAQPEILIPEGDGDRDRVGASTQAAAAVLPNGYFHG